MSTDCEVNPFRPDGELSREAENILRNSTILRDKVIINDPAVCQVNGYMHAPDGSFVSPDGDNSIRHRSAITECASPVSGTVTLGGPGDSSTCRSPVRTGEVMSGQLFPTDLAQGDQPLHQVEHVKIKSGGLKCCSIL